MKPRLHLPAPGLRQTLWVPVAITCFLCGFGVGLAALINL